MDDKKDDGSLEDFLRQLAEHVIGPHALRVCPYALAMKVLWDDIAIMTGAATYQEVAEFKAQVLRENIEADSADGTKVNDEIRAVREWTIKIFEDVATNPLWRYVDQVESEDGLSDGVLKDLNDILKNSNE